MNKGSSPTIRNLGGKKYILYQEYTKETREELKKQAARLKALGMLVKTVDCALYVRCRVFMTPVVPDYPCFFKIKSGKVMPISVPVEAHNVIYKEEPLMVVQQQKLVQESIAV